MAEREEYVTLAEAAAQSGFSVRSIAQWLTDGKIAGARKVPMPGYRERERWQIPISSLEGWRRSPPPSPASPAGEDLAERVAQLEAIIATLQRRASWLFSDAAENAHQRVSARPSAVSPLVDARLDIARDKPSESLPSDDPVQRTAYVPRADRQRMPEGWISFNAWCGSHGINPRAAEKEIAKGRMPTPVRGEWWGRPQGPTLSAYSLEQHIAASQHAALRWPARFVSCEQCAGGE